MLIRLKKSQSVAEYVVLIGIVIGAVIAMQNEIRRTLQARFHDAGRYFVEKTSVLGTTDQWEPTSSTKTITDQKSDKRKEESRDSTINISENASQEISSITVQ